MTNVDFFYNNLFFFLSIENYWLEKKIFTVFSERGNIGRNNRKLEKRIADLLMQVEDERKHADQYREQVRKMKQIQI